MISSKVLVVFFALIAVSYCDTSVAREKDHKHHHKHLFFHEFYYLIFLALKVKVILVLGTVWAFAIFFGKIFAAIKLAEYMKKNYHHDDHHHEEKIYFSPPHGSFDYPGAYGKSYSSGPPVELQNSFQQNPADAIYSEYPGSSADSYPGGSTAPEQVYGSGKSEGGDADGIYESLSSFSRIIRQLNISEIAFREMHLNTEECKKKFVCEADFNVKQSSILKTAYELLSDDSYQKYKTNQTVTSIEDCTKFYPTCSNIFNTLFIYELYYTNLSEFNTTCRVKNQRESSLIGSEPSWTCQKNFYQ
ncbi:hypothetical protein JTB14_000373 [Gonioctena quinquepunctata]|nr:hypothetical protein JTB14_000373 [Gonioctena quinquepunctata]